MSVTALLPKEGSIQVNFIPPHRNLVIWRGKSNKQLLEALNDITNIDEFSKKALLYRTSSILDEYTTRAYVYSGIYHIGRGIVTIGSLIVPALLSIQGGANGLSSYTTELYWITWSTSLLVTIFNGGLTLFKIEKKFNYLNMLQEQVRSEAWQYIHLTGKYGGHHFAPEPSTHKNELVHFTHSLERIKLNQTNEEFWKSQDSSTKEPKTSLETKALDALYVPTPSTQQLLEASEAEDESKIAVPK